MSAFDALEGGDCNLARDWVLRGERLGDEQPQGSAGEFCARYLAASSETRCRFRSQLIAEPERVL
jgi:hypothetical protein